MKYTKSDLKRQLQDMGLQGDETILIHSSMKAIGSVEGGADAVLDALMEFFRDGLLLLPTHTWKTVHEEQPVFDVKREDACVGILPNLFMRRDGVIRSAHPTHSMAGYGRDAKAYLAGEELCNTPCTPGGCYDRLRSVAGKILLIGVGHERNTYIHSVEEVLNVPNRLSAKPMKLQVIMADGTVRDVYMRKHYNPDQPHISEDFVKLTQAFLDCGAAENFLFGSADCILCDAGKIFEVTRHVLAPDPECLITCREIAEDRWKY
ncbi:MAG: AAC(3) family N-acetyltransferase [Acetatifactor sp.]|nr:AAC(3) family N-acetyltransferase [Acetatifactor sp.]